MTDLRSLASPPTHNAPQAELDALVALYSQGRVKEALGLAAQLIARHPFCEIAHNIAGAIAAAAGLRSEAVQLYDRAIAIAPDYVEAHTNRGNVLKDLQRTDEALDSYDAALALMPGYALAHLNRAIVLRAMKRFDEALAANGAAIRCDPRLPQAYSNRGNVLQDLNRYKDALADYDKAVKLDPASADARLNRGNVLQALKRLPEAVASYDRAIALAPGNVLAHRNRGSALKLLKRFDEALASFETACALDPADVTALGEALFLEAQLCIWDRPERRSDLTDRVRAGEPIQPFHLLALADDAALQLANARAWAGRHFPEQRANDFGSTAKEGKIRLGYFSSDFHNHATMELMLRMLELHDKARFEVHAFSYGPQIRDAVRERVIRAVDRFHDISTIGDQAAAKLARDMGIDIAVDLKGYTQDGRPGIFAWRPAPHQVAYLGFPGSTGAAYVDFMIADRVTVPEDRQGAYAEQILYLPGSYQVNDDERAVASDVPSRSELGLPESGFVFCCFNGSYKLSPAEFDIWMRLLSQVAGSVLWLLDDNPQATANLRREAQARGVDPDRLIFAPRVTAADHLARQTRADLFLDTFAVNAHTTASEALWVGLPVLAKLGDSFVARVAGSLLHAVGLPELVTENAADYEALALALATDPAQISPLKAKLAANRGSAPLFDTRRFTRNIETLFASIARA